MVTMACVWACPTLGSLVSLLHGEPHVTLRACLLRGGQRFVKGLRPQSQPHTTLRTPAALFLLSRARVMARVKVFNQAGPLPAATFHTASVTTATAPTAVTGAAAIAAATADVAANVQLDSNRGRRACEL